MWVDSAALGFKKGTIALYLSIEEALDQKILLFDLPEVGKLLSRRSAFELAIQVAWQGLGRVSPNPCVGAVIVDHEHRFLEWGYHSHFGAPHAEQQLINKLKIAGKLDRLKNATLYVTLEPCSHIGKTPSCAEILKKLPLKKIVYGLVDPNTLVKGRGLAILSQAGILCEEIVELRTESQELLEIFTCNQSKSRPFFALKAAISQEGFIGLRGTGNHQITSQRSRQYGHFLRAMYDGIAIGSTTVLHDNPMLTCRHPNLTGLSPRKIVFDGSGQLLRSVSLSKLKVFNHEPEKLVWICGSLDSSNKERLEDAGASVVRIDIKNGFFEMQNLCEALIKLNIHSVLLEGGAGLYHLFLKQRMVDRLYLFQSLRKLGGENPIMWISDGQMAALDYDSVRVSALDGDILFRATLK